LTLGIGLSCDLLAQKLDQGFDPGADNTVQVVLEQSDGKLLVAGEFTNIAGASRRALVRLNADGSLDSGFNPAIGDGAIYAMALQPDGRILIGGTFTQVGPSSRNRLARLNANGSLDTAFDVSVQGTVRALALQADRRILVGGDFSSIGGSFHYYVGRLYPDGTVDDGFDVSPDPTPGASTYAIVVQPDGYILVAGTFGIGRVSAGDGSYVGAFPVVNNGSVYRVALQADGGILIGGAFTSLTKSATTTPRNHLARLDTNGNVDQAFNPAPDSSVLSLGVQADGRILVGGLFANIASTARSRAARLDANGGIDTAFNPNVSGGDVLDLDALSDGGIVVVGSFSGLVNATPRSRIGRINVDGSLDVGFAPIAQTQPYAIAQQPDGRVLVAADFQGRNNLARFNVDGSLDAFNPDIDFPVKALAVLADGSLLIGGSFTTVGGTARNHIARLGANGSLDAAFNPAFGATDKIYAFAVQPDGAILVAGSFSGIAGGSRHNIARLNPNGSLDAGFDSGVNPNSEVYCVAVQADGRILIGGNFTTIGVTTRKHIARLNANGSLDAGFDPSADFAVFVVAPQPDARILVGGQFATIGGGTHYALARLQANGSHDSGFVADALQSPGVPGTVWSVVTLADGRILVGGQFATIAGGNHQHIARLGANGVLDAAFEPGASARVFALAVQVDGRILVGGDFTSIGGGVRNYFVRLSVPDSAGQSLDINGTTAAWRRTGAMPELTAPPQLLFSADGVSYSPASTMIRVADTWTGVFAAPVGPTFFLRARGATGGGYYNASTGGVDVTRKFNVSDMDRIFAATFE